MEWNAVGLFPTPLLKVNLNGAERAREFFHAQISGESEESSALVHFHSNDNVFTRYPDLRWLQESIEEAGNFVYRELLNYKQSGAMKIVNAWFNLCNVHGAQTKHNHANSLLSGTFYLTTDENTNIRFFHPLTTVSMHPELFDTPDGSRNEHGLHYHHRDATVSVSDGECLFWPSELQHGYDDNKTPSRLSLSFNMMPEKLNTTYQAN